jgi:predicted SprT family Zn-dependent metalloprotease
MNVPTCFKLFAQTILVEFDLTFFQDREGVYGYADYRRNRIILRPPSELVPVNKEQLEQTFLHELMHFILYHVGNVPEDVEYLHQNEGLVDLSASLLHQALTTMEYAGTNNYGV